MSRRDMPEAEYRALRTIGRRHVSLALIEGRRIYAVDLHLGRKWAGSFLPADIVRRLQDDGMVVGEITERSGETTYHLTERGSRARAAKGRGVPLRRR